MNTSAATWKVSSSARPGAGSVQHARPQSTSAPTFRGLTMAQAQDCLDWLQNHGWQGYTLKRDGERWNVFPE